MAELTVRIGAITDELRTFSRKSSRGVSPVNPCEAIDGAMLLMSGGLRAANVDLVRTGLRDVRVMADLIRLEQVIVNLVQNAFEAMAEHAVDSPQVVIDIARRGRRIEISISDNGPGVDPAIAGALFTPFVTTKTKGLWLGLVTRANTLRTLCSSPALLAPEARSAKPLPKLKSRGLPDEPSTLRWH